MSLGKEYVSEVRSTLLSLFNEKNQVMAQNSYHVSNCDMHLPCHIGDYTDFYSSYHHAFNVGCLIRGNFFIKGPENAIKDNWRYLPVGYHGRASSIVVSGTDITRPRGQVKPPTAQVPTFTTVKRFDFELEIGMFIGGSKGKVNEMGKPIKVNEAENYIFGYVLCNDWSARDV